MGFTRIRRLDAADSGAGAAGRSQVHDIFRMGNSRVARSMQLWPLGVLCPVVIWLEQVHPLAFRAPTLRAVIETATTLCAVAAACLFGLSFGHRKRLLRDLLVVAGLTQLATIDLVSYLLPAALGVRSPSLLGALPLLGTVLAIGLLAAGAWAGDELAVRPGRKPLALAVGGSLICAAAAGFGAFVLQAPVAAIERDGGHGLGSAIQHPLFLGFVIVAAALFVTAAGRLELGHESPDSSVSGPLTAGMIVFAIGVLTYVVSPTPGIGQVTANEGMRLVGCSLVFLAVVRHEWAIRRAIAANAAAAERRRIAHDLHDGLAQDLAFIAAHGARISGESGEDHPVAVAARRALAASRGAIADLSASDASSVEAALRSVAGELEVRFGVRVAVDADDTQLSRAARDGVVRIAREAIVNAARAGSRNIVVSLARKGERFVLRVLDDGDGIQTGELKERAGFGLRAMHERATALGGGLTARPASGGGTELEVVFP